MAKKSKKEEGYEIYLTYEEGRSGGEVRAGYEDADWPNYENKYIDFSLIGAWRTSADKSWVETVTVDFDPVKSDKVYVVVVRYSTGNTFGKTCGDWHIEGAYSNLEIAEKIAKTIIDDTYKGYKPWSGFFESLEDVSVECMTLDYGKKVYTR